MPNVIEYNNYSFWETQNWNTEVNGFIYKIYVYDKTIPESSEEYLFLEQTLISTAALIVRDGRSYNPAVVEKEIRELTIAKAKSRLNLCLYSFGQNYIQEITTESLNKEIKPPEDIYIQEYLLNGLRNLRKSNPGSYKFLKIEPKGFCEILKINFKEYLFNVDLLLEERLIGVSEDTPMAIEQGLIYITSHGIKKLDGINKKQMILPTASNHPDIQDEFEYDIAISFAGEDREIAKQIAELLQKKGVRVFYDSFEVSELWGKNLYDYLIEIYSERSKYCLMLLSENYKKKLWTNHERESAQARAFRENREYILPIRLDDTKIPGIHETVGYIEMNSHSIEQIVELIHEKLNK